MDTPATRCAVDFVDEARVSRVRDALRSEPVFRDLAELFRILADPSRTKLLFALSQEELCVCDLARLFGMTQSAVSHQLRILRNTRLVSFRRDGRMIYYRLEDEHVRALFRAGLEHVEE